MCPGTSKAMFTLEKMGRFRLERFHLERNSSILKSVSALSMVLEVIKIEKEVVLNHKKPVFFGIWHVK